VEPLVLSLDFSEVNPAGSTVRGYPQNGLNKATIRSYMKYDNDDGSFTLYCNMTTGNIDHRERWGSAKGMPFLMSHLISAGVPEDALRQGPQKVPLHKLAGKTVYFNFVRPNLLPDGTAMEGSYPKYRWMSEDAFDKASAAAGNTQAATKKAVESGDFQVETPENGAGPKPTADAGNIDWILGDSAK